MLSSFLSLVSFSPVVTHRTSRNYLGILILVLMYFISSYRLIHTIHCNWHNPPAFIFTGDLQWGHCKGQCKTSVQCVGKEVQCREDWMSSERCVLHLHWPDSLQRFSSSIPKPMTGKTGRKNLLDTAPWTAMCKSRASRVSSLFPSSFFYGVLVAGLETPLRCACGREKMENECVR